jgi:hypothetical protein
MIEVNQLSTMAIAWGVLLLAGCATVEKAPTKYQEGSTPEVGVRSSATVGDPMVTKYHYLADEVAVLLKSSESNFMFGRPEVSANTRLVKTYSSKGEIYCPIMRGSPVPCFKDDSGDGKFDYAYNLGAFSIVAPIGEIDPLPYTIAESTIQDGFKYELVYQGIDDDTVRIAYREYSENLARPAFHQDLTYTLDEGDTQVSFKGVRLVIHSASNNDVEYTVSSGF